MTSRATRQPRAPPGRARVAAEHMGPRARRARGGQDEEGRRGAASKDVPRDPRHLPVDFLAERMLAAPVTCGDMAISALQLYRVSSGSFKDHPHSFVFMECHWIEMILRHLNHLEPKDEGEWRPDLLARRRLKRCPSRWRCLSAAWSFIQVFNEPDGFTVIFGGLGNNAGGTMYWNDTHPAHFRILKVVLREALAECLMDSYSLDVHGGRRTTAGCEG
ncbi:uncharacterized protein [Symphalangus syndactylus]|uniref:uncharacterized protein n=1 Tax=Symphalangus syndactylus TaxID=9590 RepID=UPI003006239C